MRVFTEAFFNSLYIFGHQAPYNLGLMCWKTLSSTHFVSSHPCVMLIKHFSSDTGLISLSNIERGDGSAGTYSVAIMVMISRVCSFSVPIFPQLL